MNSLRGIFSSTMNGNGRSALCIIVNTKGSVPRKIGAKMLVFENETIQGTIGGGDLEKKVIENALQQIKEEKAKLFEHDLVKEHGMCCGGTVLIYIEPIMPAKKLYIFGAGHTGRELAVLALRNGFETHLIDDREKFMDSIEIEGLQKHMGHHFEVLDKLSFDSDTYVAIMTYKHPYDREILAYCIKKQLAYLGVIGSLRKVKVTRKIFISNHVSTANELDRVDMPIGLDIAAETPQEIAISIMAKMIQVKNTKAINP